MDKNWYPLEKCFVIFKIAVDFSKRVSFSIKIMEFKLFFFELCSKKIYFAASDCSEANKKCFFLSFLIMKLIDELHKLQTPSNKITDFPSKLFIE